jgi:hypothetical protein
MEKINVHLRRDGDLETYSWGYSVIQVQGGRASGVYNNHAEIVGEAYVLKQNETIFDAIAVKKVKGTSQREEINNRLYGLAKNIAEAEVKRLAPELKDETQKKR